MRPGQGQGDLTAIYSIRWGSKRPAFYPRSP